MCHSTQTSSRHMSNRYSILWPSNDCAEVSQSNGLTASVVDSGHGAVVVDRRRTRRRWCHIQRLAMDQSVAVGVQEDTVVCGIPTPMRPPDHVMVDPVRICQILNEERVEYIIVGGFAAVIHGSPLPTQDIDVLPARSMDNLDRLSLALNRMKAQIRTSGDPVPAPLDGPFLASMPVDGESRHRVGRTRSDLLAFRRAGRIRRLECSAVIVEIAEGLTVR